MRKLLTAAFTAALGLLLLAGPALAIRIKDMASVKGVRGNQLVGYGLVVGLNGTGDKDTAKFTTQGISNMLTRMGVKVAAKDLKVKNVAGVMITATLPAFARIGTRVDITLSSLGDASSLEGGTLIVTPLKGLDGRVYAVAQGPISVGGFKAGGEAATVTKNHTTVGRIPRGAIVEREVPHFLGQGGQTTINLDNPDFTTALRVARAINGALPMLKARALDPATVAIDLPEESLNKVALIAQMENLDVTPDQRAKVVVDERSGTVVMGSQVRISEVAVANGSLSITVTERPEVSQALPFAQGGQTVTVPRTQVRATESKSKLAVLRAGTTIGEVVKALNVLGASPRDLITILQAIKAAGALQAELKVI